MTMLRNADGNAGVPCAPGGVRGAPGDEPCVNDAARRAISGVPSGAPSGAPPGARWLTVPMLLLAMLAAVAGFAFAPGAKAQADTFDIASEDWTHNGFTTATSFPWPGFNPAGGSGTYILPNGWEIVCLAQGAGSDASYFDAYLTVGGIRTFITQVFLDGSSSVDSTDIIDVSSGLSCHLALGTPGSDTISVPSGMDAALAFGMEGDDLVSANSSSGTTPCVFFGGDGTDTVRGGGATDFLYGDWTAASGATGSDLLEGSSSPDYLEGGLGNDTRKGESGEDLIRGSAGNDDLFGGSEADILAGEAGNDILRGEAGADLLVGGDGNDALDGGTGADDLRGDDSGGGGSGKDFLYDGDGASGDFLDGEGGDDILWSLDGGVDSIIGSGGSGDTHWSDSGGSGDFVHFSTETAGTPPGPGTSFTPATDPFKEYVYPTGGPASDDFYGSSSWAGPR